MRQALLSEKEKALNNAIASVEIEGYHVSEFKKQLCMSVFNGTITNVEFIQTMLERCAV